MRNRRHLLAISNSSAFFVEPPVTPRLARYLVRLTAKERPVIVYIGAANGDSSEKVSKFFALGQRAGFDPRHLNLFALENDDPDAYFAGADAVYVDGGSTRNLLALLREWSADLALKRAYDRGVVLSGASAGANIMFEWGMTDPVKTRIEAIRGMGLLDGSISVHADARADRREALGRHLLGPDAAYPAYSLDDGTALHFEDSVFTRAIAIKTGVSVTLDELGGHRARLQVETLPSACN